MSERCQECGTPVDEVPLVDCQTHSRVSIAEAVEARLASREGRIEYLERLVNELEDPRLRIILREIARLL